MAHEIAGRVATRAGGAEAASTVEQLRRENHFDRYSHGLALLRSGRADAGARTIEELVPELAEAGRVLRLREGLDHLRAGQ
jgi:hypothetical protein